MDQRIRFLQSKGLDRASLERLENAFRKNRFTAKTARGFLLDYARADSLRGKFIERLETSRTITDPFGESIQLPSVTYETTLFRLSVDSPQVELTNPPRSIRKFLLFLGELSAFKLAFSEPKIEILQWINDFDRAAGSVSLESVECSDVRVSPATTATVNLFGEKNLQSEMRTFLGKRSYSIEKATVTAMLGTHKVTCILDSAARFKVIPEPSEEVRAVIRNTTQRQLK